MSALLQSRAEITKLARLLGVEPESLASLEQVAPQDLRRLRERATDVLFDRDRQAMERLAAGTRLLPVQVIASIGERVFGALLCARVAGALDPARAVEVAGRLPPTFLADVAVELDPRRAKDVIGSIPAHQVGAVAAELVRRGEHVTMGRFVAFLGDDAIRAALDVIDDEGLLKIGFVLEAKERLDHVIGLLPVGRLDGIIQAAAGGGLWPEALDLLDNVSERRRGELADLAARQDEAVLEALIRSAHEEGLWNDVLPLTEAMSQESRQRFAALPAIQDEQVLDGIVDAAVRNALWPELLPLVSLLSRPAQRHVVSVAADLAEDVQRNVAEVITTADAAVLEGLRSDGAPD